MKTGKVVHLIERRHERRHPITWAYVAHARGWDDARLRLAQAEAEFNGYSAAMYLPLDEYMLVQHPTHTQLHYITVDERDG